jgi:hypothetical protein
MPNGDVCCAAIAAASSWTGSTTLGFGRALPRRCHSIDGCIGTDNGAAMNEPVLLRLLDLIFLDD